MPERHGPPLPGADSWALFLDVDGTLLELADRPEGVVVPDRLIPLLRALRARFAGAVALVSGRGLAALDGLLGAAGLDAAGCHGAEVRRAGEPAPLADGGSVFDPLAGRLAARIDGIAGAWIERKPHSLALHYRPESLDGPAARALVAAALDGDVRFRSLDGKRVVEVLPADAGKGRAIMRFLAHPPYAGRRPVFVGDDLTDEEGFEAVNRRGGVSVRVGMDGDTRARFHVPGVAGALAWLESLARPAEAEEGS